jgi:hypothetical protein
MSILVFSTFALAGAQKNTKDLLYPLGSEVNGIPFKNWPIEYWKSYLAEYDNKTTDIKDNCYSINHSSVAFLVNPFRISKATYNCNFDTNTSFFFPLFSEECDYAETHGDQNLLDCVVENNQFAKGKIYVDGVELTDLQPYHIKSDFFNLNLTSNNPFGSQPGVYRALIDGLWIFLKPLPAGDHEIKYSMVQIKPTHDNDYASEIIYKMKIANG